ncbi:MAG: hypothetical protein R3D51_03820 [Hyphomicrobiaceae bacterium]
MRLMRRRIDLTVLSVLAMVAQMLLWAEHTHGQEYEFSQLQWHKSVDCRTIVSESGLKPCPQQDHHACDFCWSHAVSGSIVMVAPAAVPLPKSKPVVIVARISVPKSESPGFVPYLSRGPPLTIAA